ncbi:MAG: DUF1080 domain-containing protein [Burkholderiales bacterium]|nr:DUF1080 domain-containing protein [Burkholderiales bacterium]
MKRLYTFVLIAAALLIAGCANMPSSGWVTLIDGEKGLENFNRIGDANWRAEGGAIVADKGKGGHLVTKETYRNFKIYAEFWADHTTNSGIFFRAADPLKIGADSSYEANIYDRRPGQEYSTGAIVNFAQVKAPLPKAGGKWNTFEIYAYGPELTVKFNGDVTVSTSNTRYAAGPFSLQFANGPKNAPGGAIKWRKVMIKPL